MGSLALCMIVKDEADRLPRCLASVEGLVDEVVVVDTGSTDGSPAVAARLGARVASFDFASVDFSAARNRALDLATCPWALVLDADETMQPGSHRAVREVVSAGANVGYVVSRRNLGDGGAECLVDHAVRIFPNVPSHRYRGRVHETVDDAILEGGGRLCTSHVVLDHHLAPPARMREKSLFYLALLQEEVARDPGDAGRLTFLAAEYHKLGMLDEATRTAEAIARLRPLDPMSHVNLGLYRLVHERDVDRATASFRRALEVRPGCREALSALEWVETGAPGR